MDQGLPDEIKSIRERLRGIEGRRAQLADDDFAGRTSLLDEEHDLEAHLAELVDRAAKETEPEARTEAASQADLTHAPDLPDDRAS